MAFLTARDQKVWLAGFDLSGVLSAIGLSYDADLKRATVFGDTGERRIAGLSHIAASHAGFWDSTIDKELFDRISLKDVPMSVGPVDAVEGSLAYFFRAAESQYSIGGAVAEMFPFSVVAEGSAGEPLVRGTLMHNAARTATANGTARQLGAVSSTQKLYAALHVLAASGTTPTLDVKVQSDDLVGFGTPTDRITFGQNTAISSEFATPVAGAITDDWWRINWTIAGTGPSFTFVVVVGIQ